MGRASLIGAMARHPLARALRLDKLALVALEATLRDHILAKPTPVQRMLAVDVTQLRGRALRLEQDLKAKGVGLDVVDGESVVGGGSLPGRSLPTAMLALRGRPASLAEALRRGAPPVIARIEAGRCCLDLPDGRRHHVGIGEVGEVSTGPGTGLHGNRLGVADVDKCQAVARLCQG